MSLMSCTGNNLINEYPLRRMHYVMGTFLSIEVFDSDEDKASEVIEIAFNEARRIERLLSRFREDSLIFKVNNLAYIQPQVIDEELFRILKDCLEFSKKTGGAFDITVAPLMELWSEAEKLNALPDREAIDYLLSKIGYQNIVLDERAKTVFLKNPLKLDLGAVGKGYALDRVVEILREKEIEKARLDFGGHLYYFDQNNVEEYVGIRNPLQPEEIIFSLPLRNKSISTSANYERNFRIQNRIYGHLINPLTGYPVDNEILSISVISSCAMSVDILSTAVFILGQNEGIKLIENINDVGAIIITNNRGKLKIYTSQVQKEVF